MRANDSLRRSCYWLPCLLWLGLCGAAARAQYRFDHWTADDGLPQNIITAITQTPEGYLWVATLDGLARFDGVRFTVFNKGNTPGLSTNRFYSLYQDARGDLWAGTEVGVVTRYHQGQFITYGTEHGLPKSFVAGLTGDQQGHVWVMSGNKIREWEPAAGRFIERASPPFSGGSGILEWHAESGFWGRDQAGLHLFESGQWTHFALPAEVAGGGPTTFVAKEGDGAIWIEGAGARIFRLKDGGVTSFPHRNQRPPGPVNHASLAARPLTRWRDRAGKIWEMEVGQRLLRELTIPSSGQTETITLRVLYEDRDGNLWLGTDGQGLYRLRKQIVTTYSREQGLISRNVYPVYEDSTGTIWVGAWEGGLSQIKAGKITNFTTREGLSAGAVHAFGEDRAGRLWIATRTDLQTFEQGRFSSVKAQVLPDQTQINVIHQDRTGAMWFGTNHGLFRYHDGRTQHFTPRDGLPGDTVRVIIEAAAGGVWIGCYGGLARWQDGRMTAWTEQEHLPGDAVRALYEDQDGVLWIGTYDSGLGRFKDGKFTSYTTREGLFNDGVFQILEDGYGYFWMSSNRGIYRVRKQELNEFAVGGRRDITSIAFGKNDGMRNVECNGGLWPAGVKTRDGRLWFPTQDGAAVIDPAAITTNRQPPPVVIESFLLDRRPIAFEGGVELQPGQTNFEIGYTALSFINADYLKFKYQLAGLDQDWIEASTRRTAYYSHVPPGEYTFKVIAANSDGVWNEQGQSLRIRVLPPFYRTWWFLTLAVLSVGGALFAAFKYRVVQLKQRQAAQQRFARQLIESQEGERKRIAAELHDSLGQHLVVIKNLALMWLQTPADKDLDGARQQIEDISATTSQAISEVKEISYNLRPYQLDRIGLTKAVEALLKKAETASGIRFRAELDDLQDALPKADEINFYRIVQECVNNVLKHSGATEAAVSIHRHGGRLRMKMVDNGQGFAPGAATGDAAKGGFGLIGIAERAQLLGGQAVIQSAPGQGTTINLEIGLNGMDARNNGR